jgi:glyoxylase-like metal-dependent hydrolase (beta-lactamase superfamily II)
LTVEELGPGIWWWSGPHPAWTPDELEGGAGWEQVVSSYALVGDDALLLFDPLIEDWGWLDRRVEEHGAPTILITILWHTRSSAAILERYNGAALWAHEPAADWIRERARVTHTFVPGDELPGAVEAIPMRRIEEVAFSLPDGRSVVIGDTILRHGDRAELCPRTWVRKSETFEGAEEAVRSLLARAPDRLLLTHGGPTDPAVLRL